MDIRFMAFQMQLVRVIKEGAFSYLESLSARHAGMKKYDIILRLQM